MTKPFEITAFTNTGRLVEVRGHYSNRKEAVEVLTARVESKLEDGETIQAKEVL